MLLGVHFLNPNFSISKAIDSVEAVEVVLQVVEELVVVELVVEEDHFDLKNKRSWLTSPLSIEERLCTLAIWINDFQSMDYHCHCD